MAAGFNVARGNSRIMLVSVNLTSDRKGTPNELHFGADGNYGEAEVVETNVTSRTDTNVQNVRLLGAYRRLFRERNYGALNGEISHDEITDVRYRLIVGPGLGRYLIKDKRNSLVAEIGVVDIHERVAGRNDNRAALRLLERFERKTGEASRIWESVEYLPSLGEAGRYLVNAEVGAETAMTARLSLRVLAQDRWNSDPEPGRKNKDLLVTAGLLYAF